jgi:thiol-disulfide isomerase/thioredoxin
MNKILIVITFISLTLTLPGCRQNTKNNSNKSVKTGTGRGDLAPELEFKSPEGNPIALSSLRGKVVLIDFWASWCPPCRRENPSLVQAYEIYKDQNFTIGNGFTIYSVSLDKNYQNWVNGIKEDHLAWPYHVSDLKFWDSQGAKIYNVNSIPSNFLIDSMGIIIDKNLRGDELQEKLQSFLK